MQYRTNAVLAVDWVLFIFQKFLFVSCLQKADLNSFVTFYQQIVEIVVEMLDYLASETWKLMHLNA